MNVAGLATAVAATVGGTLAATDTFANDDPLSSALLCAVTASPPNTFAPSAGMVTSVPTWYQLTWSLLK